MRRKIQALFLTLMLILTSAFPALAVQYGDQGEDVREVQRLLFQTGWLFEEPDGIFGPNTERAVMTYQEHYGLTPNGIVDDALLKQMQEDWDGLFYPDGTPRNNGEDWDGDGVYEVPPDNQDNNHPEPIPEDENHPEPRPEDEPEEPVTEAQTEAAPEPAPETEPATEAPTEAATEPATEAATEPATEAATEPETEAVTEPETEAATEAEKPTEHTFTIDSFDGILDGYSGPGGDVTVPSYIDDVPVLAAKYGVFSGNPDITSVTFQDPLKKLQSGVIQDMENLTSVTLPDTLSIIDRSNFFRCSALTSVTLPARVTLVRSNCFSWNDNLREVIFKGAVPIFESSCFTSVPEDIVIRVPDDQIDAYREALPNMADNIQGSGEDAVICDYSVPETAFTFDAESGTITGYKGFYVRVDVPEQIGGVQVKAIGKEAFRSNRYLYVCNLPEGVESIGEEAFSYMNNITWVSFPSTLKVISPHAFHGYHGEKIGWNEGLEEIGEGAFNSSSLFDVLELPASVRTIGDEAFKSSNIYNLYLGGSLESIGAQAFSMGTLRYMALNEYHPVDIAPDAFAGTALADLDLPWDCSLENQEAYREIMAEQAPDCYVWINNPTDCENPSGDYLFTEGSDGFYALTRFASDQETLLPWHTVENDDGDYVYITALGDGVFAGNKTLKKFRVPHSDHFTTIGSEAFADSNIETVDLYYTTETIGDGAFRNCTKLEEITLPKSVTSIGADAFAGCTGLKKITILCDPSVIPEGAFADCSALETVTQGPEASDEENRAFAASLGISLHASAEEMKAFGGTWYLGSIEEGGYTLAAVDAAAEGGLELADDYTAVRQTPDGGQSYTWAVTADGLLALTDGAGELVLTPEEEGLVLTENGQTLRYVRTPVESAFTPAGQTIPENADAFTGTWQIVRVITGGRNLPADMPEAKEAVRSALYLDAEQLEISGTQVSWSGQDLIYDYLFEEGTLKQSGTLKRVISLLEDGMIALDAGDPILYLEKISDETTLPVPEPEPEAVPVPAEAYELYGGEWFLTEITMNGAVYDPAQMGLSAVMTLNEDGTADMNSNGNVMTGIWTVDDEGITVSLTGQDPVRLAMDGNDLSGSMAGQGAVFSREEGTGTSLQPAAETAAQDAADFNGTWKLSYLDIGGNYMPMSEQLFESLKSMFGAVNDEIVINDGTVLRFGHEPAETFTFANGRLELIDEDMAQISPGTFDEIIRLHEDGTLSLSMMGFTFYCEKAEGGAEVPETEEAETEAVTEAETEAATEAQPQSAGSSVHAQTTTPGLTVFGPKKAG